MGSRVRLVLNPHPLEADTVVLGDGMTGSLRAHCTSVTFNVLY